MVNKTMRHIFLVLVFLVILIFLVAIGVEAKHKSKKSSSKKSIGKKNLDINTYSKTNKKSPSYFNFRNSETLDGDCNDRSCRESCNIACQSNSDCGVGYCENPGTCGAACVDCFQAPACFEDADCRANEKCYNPGECGAFCS